MNAYVPAACVTTKVPDAINGDAAPEFSGANSNAFSRPTAVEPRRTLNDAVRLAPELALEYMADHVTSTGRPFVVMVAVA